MPSGRLGAVQPVADTDTLLLVNPTGSGKVQTVNVTAVNQTGSNQRIMLALVVGSTANDLAATDYLEFDTPLIAKGVLERTALVVGQGQALVVRATNANVNFVAHGFEQPDQ